MASPPAVLLTDIGMPGMGAWSVHSGAAEHGACAVLVKPCPGRELIDVVESLAARGAHAHCPTSTICLDPSNFSV
ncbi:hypothetical protein ACQP2E_18145 [Actinoplanes sp. CA-015351]|uniref:hypothetical protein n=1 Tax=Actinoplanes sp. CA-015351 TaxID=3239897 RepID=UPI003D9A01E9